MHDWCGALAVTVLAAFIGLQLWWTWRLVYFFYFRAEAAPQPEAALPKAAVVLSVRGDDPTLEACLRGVLDQDYPHYRVRVVVDHPDDPAWGTVRRVVGAGARPNVDVRVAGLRERVPTCTLKVSSHLQGVRDVGADAEVIAFVDADAVPPRAWLRRLVAPFADPAVGGVSGLRWYVPREPNLGSLVRHLFNTGAYCQQVVFANPWGGSMALRGSFVRGTDLLDVWSRAFSDDASAGDALHRHGKELRFVPELTMVDEGRISLGDCCRFIRRQLLCPRLDMRVWRVWLLALVGVTYAPLAALLLAGVAAAGGDWEAAAWPGGLFALYVFGQFGALALMERRVRELAGAPGRPVARPQPFWRLLPALVTTLVVFSACLPAALFARRVAWRGVSYAVAGPGAVRLLRYRPFAARRERHLSGRG